jgi:hypothetical protein
MRAPLAIAAACLVTLLSAEAATTCSKTYKVVSGDTVSFILSWMMGMAFLTFFIY